jgi:tetrahydromethanopterin S-methyltransferase subunit G
VTKMQKGKLRKILKRLDEIDHEMDQLIDEK